MVADMSRERERSGTRGLMLAGVGAAIVLFAAGLVWGFVFVPHGAGSAARQPSAANGILANQRSGESTVAKKDRVTPVPSSTGGAGQSSTAEAQQIDQSAGPLKLSDAQRRRIRAYFAGKPANRVHSADFALSVGAAVPHQLTLQKLPAPISTAMNGFQGDQYVLVGSELVIVDPSPRRVVALVPNAG